MSMRTLAGVVMAAGIAGGAAAQSVTYTFEPPAYSPGFIAGQSGWSGFGPFEISTSNPHGGTQSAHLLTPTGGSASHATGSNSNLGWGLTYDIFINQAETNTTACCAVNLGTGLGRTFYVGIYGNGNIEIFGSPVLHDSLGLGALNQWLHVDVSGYNPTGDINVSVTGTGINRTFHSLLPVQYVRQDIVTMDMNNELLNSDTGGNWYVDNLTVWFVPAPSAAVALLLGAGVVTRRRRV